MGRKRAVGFREDGRVNDEWRRAEALVVGSIVFHVRKQVVNLGVILVVGARLGQVLPVGVIFLVVDEGIFHAGKLWR